MQEVTAREALSDAIRYWEPRRILYNGALLAVVAAVFLTHLPALRANWSSNTLQGLFVLAVLANVAYCAAYGVDIVLQISAFRAAWLRARWALLVIGIAFAAILANWFSHGFLSG